jgi:hypothetical protein
MEKMTLDNIKPYAITASEAYSLSKTNEGNQAAYLKNAMTIIKKAACAGKFYCTVPYSLKGVDCTDDIIEVLKEYGYDVIQFHTAIRDELNVSWKDAQEAE